MIMQGDYTENKRYTYLFKISGVIALIILDNVKIEINSTLK